MDGSTKLAIGILTVFGAMVCFYFAFHPGGVNLGQGEENPQGVLKWMITQFQDTAGVTPSGG